MISKAEISRYIEQIEAAAHSNERVEVYSTAISLLDLTTLSPRDTERSVRELAERVVSFYNDYPALGNVASICVYPPFVECVGLVIDGSPMRITSVAGGFPASQTLLEVKALEVAMVVESGADEVDIVLPVGKVREGELDDAASEVAFLREEAGDATLKVIIESGELESEQMIYDASMCAIHAGADFIKTSTGKSAVSATPEAVVVMCQAIKDHYAATGEMVGIKIAGGVRTLRDVAIYYTIVDHILGEKWLRSEYFRIGASSLANTLLSAIIGEEVEYF